MRAASRRLAALLAAWLTASAGGAARADVGDYLGKRIASVRIVLEGHDTTDSSLVQAVATQVGRPLSMADVRESVSHLFSLGRFDDVRVDAALDAAGVALRYDLSPIHPVTKIVFAGKMNASGVSTGALRQAVVGRYGVSPPLGRAADVARVVADTLHERGYLRATATPRADLQHAPDRATLVLTIDPGPRTTIGTVDIVGTPSVPRAELLSKLRIAPGTPYERDALAARTTRYVEDRRKHGYYEAKILPSVSLADDGRTANLTVMVNPGPHVRVVFVGDPLPSDRRAEFVPIEREGSADEDLLEDSSRRIEDYLKDQGYRDASAPHTRQLSGEELLITFDVSKGRQYRVDHVIYSGNSSMVLAEFEPNLRLRDGQPYADARLDADILLIEALYHRRGFASARAQPSIDVRMPSDGDTSAPVPVAVTVVVNEGVRTTVGSVQFQGNASIPESTLRPWVGLQAGGPFSDAQARADGAAVQTHYADLGYQTVTVELKANFSADGARADPVFVINEGPRLFVNRITIVGNVRTSTETIARELQLKEGDPFSLTAVNEAQRRLASLGLFRRTRITELGHGNETTRDLLVAVEEAPVTTIGYGGGGELLLKVVRRAEDGGAAAEKVEFGPRASFQIGRRNLFGKNRSANLYTSFSLTPKDPSADDPSAASSGGYGFTEYRFVGTFREPRVLDTAADLSITGSLEQQSRSTFNFARRGAGVQVGRRLTREWSVSGNYQIQRTKVFDLKTLDLSLIDRAFPQVRLSSFSGALIGDTRNDPVNPGSGHYWSGNGQLAARAIGSEVGFVKSFFTAQVFRTVSHAHRIVLAGDARLGLATGFAREHILVGSDGQSIVEVVKDLPASERFFAGGDTTVRGFALDTLGAPGTISVDGFPIGGNGLVIFNGELRFPIWGPVGGVGFFDTGNVFSHATEVDLTRLRSAMGAGLRIGPVRFDVGFKLHREEIVPGRLEGRTAWHISFGQAF